MNPCEQKLTNTLHDLAADHKMLAERVSALDRLMEAKFVTFNVMVSSQAEKVALALAAADKATASALAAQKEGTQAAFNASEKAIEKAEGAQNAYNLVHNDLVRKMDDQNKGTMPRSETESRFSNLEEKIGGLRQHRSAVEGSGQGMRDMWGWVAFAIMALIAVAGIYVGR